MPRRHYIQLIAKQRPFDEEQWKRLLLAFAYVLHERRTARSNAAVPQTTLSGNPATDAAPASGDTAWTP